METQQLLLPASIVIAGGLVGAGLLLGLRGQPPDRAPPAMTAEGVRPAPIATAATNEPVRTPPPGVSRAMQVRLDEHAAAVVARERPRLVKECWEPSVKKSASPPALTVRVRLLFDPSGKQRDFAVADDPARPDVIECVRRSGLVVTAPEPSPEGMATQLSLSFP